ncbi:hypothetical protein HY04AAS1_0844 [Hydrogenobaculum sp. Y04AAS1]|jgi:hypothetical protein|uniref:hypothetical protein n=1 Tax=Hydrogenobaculum sp. (strain Y04AAS1) TaxID=380749 RepID=UPI00017BBDAC|nr:hypothetical protein HY04AAS1_0844 [Hydrogenobaculum sp. Y04AAS1]HCT66096.1 hypothetical protein [Hydrogenobaculum sp.]
MSVDTFFLGIIAICMVVITIFWIVIASSILLLLKRLKDMTYLASLVANLVTYIRRDKSE